MRRKEAAGVLQLRIGSIEDNWKLDTLEKIYRSDKRSNKHDRPGIVVFVIVTDGLENASREFTTAKIKEMIDVQTNIYKWQFTYLGANQDAFSVGSSIGIGSSASASYSTSASSSAFSGASANVCRMRSVGNRFGGATGTWNGEGIVNSYTAEERSLMAGNDDQLKAGSHPIA